MSGDVVSELNYYKARFGRIGGCVSRCKYSLIATVQLIPHYCVQLHQFYSRRLGASLRSSD